MDAAEYKHLVLGFICVKYVCPQLTNKPFTLWPLHYLPSLRKIRLKPKPWPPCATPAPAPDIRGFAAARGASHRR